MNIQYQLGPEDFLTYQLYAASQSDQIRKKRRNSRWVVPVFYLALGLYFFMNEKASLAIILGMTAIAWVIAYPYYARWRYKRHYQRHIQEHYSQRVDRPSSLDLGQEYIVAEDEGSESRIKRTEVNHVVELTGHYLIQLQSGQTFIVPKSSIEDIPAFVKLWTTWGIPLMDETNWQWT